MKILAWLLLLLNLGLLVYFNLETILPSTPKITLADMAPEKIVLLSPQQIKALPKKTASVAATTVAVAPPAPIIKPAPATYCFEWGTFSPANMNKVKDAVTKLALQPVVKEQSSQDNKRFWIYVPPLKSAEIAQTKAEEFKALGIEDIYVVQEPKWKNAISFGLFEDEKLAQSLLSELKSKGINNVQKSLWKQEKGHASLLFNNIAESDAVVLKKLKSEYPETDLKKVSCR